MYGLNAVKEALLETGTGGEQEQAKQISSHFSVADDNLKANRRVERGTESGKISKQKDGAILDQSTLRKARAHIDRKYTSGPRDR